MVRRSESQSTKVMPKLVEEGAPLPVLWGLPLPMVVIQ